MTLAPLLDSAQHVSTQQRSTGKQTTLRRLLGKGLDQSDLFISALTYRLPGQWHERVEAFRAWGTNSNLHIRPRYDTFRSAKSR